MNKKREKNVTDRKIIKETRAGGRKITSADAEYAACNAFDQLNLNDLVVGPSNELAIGAARFLIKNDWKRWNNPLYLYGKVGVGKTILLHAIANELLARKNDARICYIRADDLLNKYVDALKNAGLQRFRDEFRSLDCLLLDDAEDIVLYKSFENELFQTVTAIMDAQHNIVVASNRNLLKMPGVTERLRAILSGGISIGIKVANATERLAILKKKVSQSDCALSEDQLQDIARRCTDMNEMIGAIHLIELRERVSRD